MTPIEIRAGNRSYRVHIESGLLGQTGAKIADLVSRQTLTCAIISDCKVAPLFGGKLEEALKKSGFKPIWLTVPAGENSKSLEQAGAICNEMIAAGLDRTSLVIGLGGGVIGDLSGFVAAIYQRGIPHVQIPTTLLAMVDSSIGGKTGVNTIAGKNLLGAVHHPLLVIDDVDVLQSLPPREFNQGFAEIIKHGVIADAEMLRALQNFDRSQLASLIRRNVEIKVRIVASDEFDRTGERAILNFGHTIGHAIERAGEYQQFLHGEAISLGMIAAAHVSVKRAGLSDTERQFLAEVISAFDLPTKLPPDFPREKIFAALPFDKKFEQGHVRFVVTPRFGAAHLSNEVTMDDMREGVAQL